jgi:hypothetical protein
MHTFVRLRPLFQLRMLEKVVVTARFVQILCGVFLRMKGLMPAVGLIGGFRRVNGK